VGSGVARKLSLVFNTIEKLKNATIEELEKVDEIGPSISNSLVQYFSNSENIKTLKSLVELGLNFKGEEEVLVSSNLSGLSIVVTGTLSRMSRDDAKEKILLSGGKFVSSLSKKTDFLVAGENAGSKLEKAKTLGVKIISEDEFINLLNQ
jgi:DNA ligase (NAD+)